MTRYLDLNPDFKCSHCGHLVISNPMTAGVNNRNHCPTCLWSRHMDLFEAGDRLSACKAPMQPVGLTFKRSRKKYAPALGGELMLVHVCTGCGRVCINRIAADDDPENILAVYHGSTESPPARGLERSTKGITLLGPEHLTEVWRQLYGWRRQPELAV